MEKSLRKTENKMVQEKSESNKYETLGYTTVAALGRLEDDIREVLLEYEKKYENEKCVAKLKSAFFQGYDCPISWFPIIISIYVIISLLATANYFAALVLSGILIFTISFSIREYNLKQTEIYRKVRNVMDDIRLAKDLCKDWTAANYPHLCSPLSPCVTLQWTYRDNVIVNLPWALLVRGDYIVLRPGQVSPGKCSEHNGKRKFKCGETYGLTQASEQPPLRPTAISPLPDLICIMESTPYLETLKTSLDQFLLRPPTIYNQQRHLLITKCVQQFGLITVFLITICSGAIYYFDFLFEGEERLNVKELFIELPAITLIPILPLIFPLMWVLLNLWGTARLETLLSVPEPIVHSDQDRSFQEDLDTPTFDWEHASLSTKQITYNWIALLRGSSDLLARSTNVVQIFGSITALCCIDKKGILSWPNPTAEKIFFLRDSSDNDSDGSDKSSFGSESTTNMKNGTIAEVLDLTHDQHCPFKLEFDDHEWKNHINSLKPLGLAILVNTCCPLTQAHYAKFCGHVTAVAMLDKDLVPVTNRYAIVESSLNSFMHGRCLCELAKQIGFTENARQIFNLEGQIASYRHLQPDVVKRDIRFARSLHLAAKVKVPFPHSLSVVMRERHDGSLQLLTQGTADLVLDCCDDFWDGKDLRPLGLQERKRAQEFYQRSALTAYCTAFAYRPLRHGICGILSGKNRDIAYLELPPETKTRMEHVEKSHCDFERHTKLNHSISSDSLLFSENKEDDIADVEGCFEMQCHQVFIGMVCMQYQAKSDIVQLIERLDRACIRFVHFSKENELRSRVFSEKMGLESGWNCHISLLSGDPNDSTSPKNSRNFDSKSDNVTIQINESDNEDNLEINRLLPLTGLESTKTLSSSAPGAISNQETNNAINALNNTSKNNSVDSFEMQRKSSKDSAMECQTQCEDQNCRSLSCLTDSTEQSAPVHFDMSNRAKLPRGIENIRPHLENVDNVPLLVSLFTDCSAGATREMLKIMQQYGEIVVCLGSSASNSNAEIFLQADCSIACEPLYPQVCQDYPSYTEANIYKNKWNSNKSTSTMKWFQTFYQTRNVTISPIYLSRMLNSISCSISVCRDDPISLVALIELSRRYTLGLWNCIQFWLCCGCSLALMNTISSCLALPPMITPIALLYLMCIAVPMIAVPLSRISSDSVIMKRATGKKQTSLNSNVIIFVIWCYGGKFLTVIVFMAIAFCAFLSHPFKLLDLEVKNFDANLKLARIFILLSVVIHFLIVSISFVHREYSIWKKNPFTNYLWCGSSIFLIIFHILICIIQISTDDNVIEEISKTWPIILFLIISTVITFAVVEICKLEEIKVNLRYQRRARLDFGTKLGMNSPF